MVVVLSTNKYYHSKYGMPYYESAGANFWTPYVLPRNLIHGVNYNGFIPAFNLNLSKADLFSYLNLNENMKGIGVEGISISLPSTKNYILRTANDMQIIAQNLTDIVLAGDVVNIKGIKFYVLEAYGEFNGISKTYKIDMKLSILKPKQNDYDVHLANKILIDNQNLQNINITNAISTAINAALAGTVIATPAGAGSATYPGLLSLPDIISSVLSENATLQQKIELEAVRQ